MVRNRHHKTFHWKFMNFFRRIFTADLKIFNRSYFLLIANLAKQTRLIVQASMKIFGAGFI